MQTSRLNDAQIIPSLLSSKLISKEVLEWYTKAEDKLKKDLAQITLEDHIWMLKSWDQNGVPFVKLWCEECKKPFGGDSGDHTKAGVTNLYSNFKKNHIMTVGHAKNYCRCKGIEWKDYPQSGHEKGGKILILTAKDHKCLIKEGMEFVEIVNAKSDFERPPFVIVGDVNSDQIKCFWLKVKCTYCFDFYQLCPPKKIFWQILKTICKIQNIVKLWKMMQLQRLVVCQPQRAREADQ